MGHFGGGCLQHHLSGNAWQRSSCMEAVEARNTRKNMAVQLISAKRNAIQVAEGIGKRCRDTRRFASRESLNLGVGEPPKHDIRSHPRPRRPIHEAGLPLHLARLDSEVSEAVLNDSESATSATSAILARIGSTRDNATTTMHSDSDVEEPAASTSGSQEEELVYYEPKMGDTVVGVVISGNDSKLDIDIGAQKPGMMFTRDMTPFEKFKMEDRMWSESGDVQSVQQLVPPSGKACLVRDDEVLIADGGGLIVEPGTAVCALVMGKTLSGRALLSIRNFARPIAWQRVREIYNTEEMVEVRIETYNLGGLIGRIEGLTAFLPKDMIQNSPRDVTGLKNYVGKHLFVLIVEVDEPKTRLVVSERAAWVQQVVPPDSLVEGVVTKVESFGVIVNVDGTDLSGLLHISNISHKRIPNVADIFSEGDRVKAVVMKPRAPGKVVLSTAFLEREKGLIITDKEKVFEEAEEAFKVWKTEKEKYIHDIRIAKSIPFEQMLELATNEEQKRIANFDWVEFDEEN